MKLATLSEIRSRLHVREHAKFDKSISAWNERASNAVWKLVCRGCASPEAATHTDYFYIEASDPRVDLASRVSDGRPFFSASTECGFIDRAYPVTVSWATRLSDLTGATNGQVTDLTNLENYLVDYEKGRIKFFGAGPFSLRGFAPLNVWYRVTYTAGFEFIDDDDWGRVIADEGLIPHWMTDAVVSLIGAYERADLSDEGSSGRGRASRFIDQNAMPVEVTHMLSAHIRNHPIDFWPEHSVRTAIGASLSVTSASVGYSENQSSVST